MVIEPLSRLGVGEERVTLGWLGTGGEGGLMENDKKRPRYTLKKEERSKHTCAMKVVYTKGAYFSPRLSVSCTFGQQSNKNKIIWVELACALVHFNDKGCHDSTFKYNRSTLITRMTRDCQHVFFFSL